MADGALERLPTVTVNGVSLAYREHGGGEPVVLVHGSASDLRTWNRQVEAIGARYRTVAYSRRYARPNDGIPAGADDRMLVHVDDLVAFMQSLDVSPAHLVGHSWGGFIALLAAIRHPGSVRSLVPLEPPVLSLFVSTPPRIGELLPLLFRRPGTALAIVRFGAGAMARARTAFARGDDEAALRAIGEGLFGKRHFAAMPPERTQQVRDNLATERAQLLGAGFPPLADEEVRGVRAPVLLFNGEHSATVLRRLGDRLAQLLPDVERIVVPGASHLMHEDNPRLVNEAILDFLGRTAAGTSS